MKFCSDCGSPLTDKVPAGDDRSRRVCTQCDRVHYQNPLVVVGCLVESDHGILLCRRAIEPGYGRWTTPAGFLELGETLAAGARRETLEEAGAEVEITAPHSSLDLTHIGQHYAMFRARLLRDRVVAGVESLECRFFHPTDIPWSELAFPAVHFALRLLLNDRNSGQHHVHHGRLCWNGRDSRFDPNNYVIEEHVQTPLATPPAAR